MITAKALMVPIAANTSFSHDYHLKGTVIVPKGLYVLQWAEVSQVIVINTDCGSVTLTYPAAGAGGQLTIPVDRCRVGCAVASILVRIPGSTPDIGIDRSVKDELGGRIASVSSDLVAGNIRTGLVFGKTSIS